MTLALFANAQCYSVSTIPYNPAPYSGTSVSIGADAFSPRIAIGFNFCFYGHILDSLVIGSNGIVTFDATYPYWIDYCNPVIHDIPLPSSYASVAPGCCVMMPWQDLNPSLGGNISYASIGVAPNRVFIVSFDNVPMDSCSKVFKGQVKLFETTNIIETHIGIKDTCTNWNHGRAAHGLNGFPINTDQPMGVFVDGRNYPNCVWTATNEGTQFTPTCNVCLPLSINENNSSSDNFSIFPNPFSISAQISFDKTYPTIALSLYDLQGKLLLQNHYADCNQITLHRNQLSNGLYFLKLIIDDKQIETRKIVVGGE